MRADKGLRSVGAEDAALLREYLRAHDAKCVICGYQLRGLETSTCPECGATPELIVWPRGFSLAPWGATLVLLAMPMGVAALIAVALVVKRATTGALSPEAMGVVIANAAVLAGGVLAFATLWQSRRKLWRQSVRVQWGVGLALGLLAWVAIAIVVLLAGE